MFELSLTSVLVVAALLLSIAGAAIGLRYIKDPFHERTRKRPGCRGCGTCRVGQRPLVRTKVTDDAHAS